MTELLQFLSRHPVLLGGVILAVVLLALALVGLFIFGFRQGREVQLFPPRIGPRLTAISETSLQSRRIRFFVTTPLTGYDNEERYRSFMATMTGILRQIRRLDRVLSVYYFNEEVDSLAEFEAARFSVPEYLARIDECDCFILIVEHGFLSSVYFEAGYALARGKKAIYFVREPSCIPHLMRRSGFAFPQSVSVCEFARFDEIPELLRQAIPNL